MAGSGRTAQREEIRASLVAQLAAKGADTPPFTDLVDKYMDMWDDVGAMRKDIRERGRRYRAVSASGKEYEKENENVKLIPAYLRQMQSVLSDLKISADRMRPPDGGYDEL